MANRSRRTVLSPPRGGEEAEIRVHDLQQDQSSLASSVGARQQQTGGPPSGCHHSDPYARYQSLRHDTRRLAATPATTCRTELNTDASRPWLARLCRLRGHGMHTAAMLTAARTVGHRHGQADRRTTTAQEERQQTPSSELQSMPDEEPPDNEVLRKVQAWLQRTTLPGIISDPRSVGIRHAVSQIFWGPALLQRTRAL